MAHEKDAPECIRRSRTQPATYFPLVASKLLSSISLLPLATASAFFSLDILAEEVTPELLDGVAAVHLDSRHTPAAIALAKLANKR